MDHLGKEIAANEVVASAESQSEEFDHHHPEPEGRSNGFDSRACCVSTSSEIPENPSHASLDKLEVSGRGVMSTDNAKTLCTNPYDAGGGKLVIDGLKLGNLKFPNSALVRGSNDCEGTNEEKKGHRQHLYQLARGSRSRTSPKGLIFGDEGGGLFNSREEKDRKLLAQKELMPLVTQNTKGLNQVATAEANDCNEPISSYRQSLGYNNQSKILSSSSFAKVFGKRYLQGKGVESKHFESEVELCYTSMNPIKIELPFLCRKPSDTLETQNAAEGQPSLQNTNGNGSVSSRRKPNLREWLSSGVSEIRKADRLQLFRQIVQSVDIAHSEGIGLEDLRPSNFIFESPNSIKYAGSFSASSELVNPLNQVINKKRPLKQDMQSQSTSGAKQQYLGKDVTMTTDQVKLLPACGTIRAEDTSNIDVRDDDSTKCIALKYPFNESTSILTSSCLDPDIVQLEKKWYACPGELIGKELLSANIYGLGVLLFELLCHFESSDKHSAAMWDLGNRILPAYFLSGNPKEAGFCFWLLHPESSCRPTSREILQSEIIYSSEEVDSGNNVPSCLEKDEDTESELLLHFLVSLEEQKRKHASTLLGGIECLEADIKEVGRTHAPDWMGKDLTHARWDILPKYYAHMKFLQKTFSVTDVLEENLVKNIGQLEKAYFSMRSELKLKENPSTERSDKDLLSHRDRHQAAHDPNVEGKSIDRVGVFFEAVCRFARYSKFEVCGGLKNGDLLNSTNVICSLSLDRDEDYIAAAVVSRKIKIFEFSSLLNDSVDIQYSMVEMSNKSKLSCVCWNHSIKNYLGSTDYDGAVQIWDASTSQAFAYYSEHQKRAWSVDFSPVDPGKFASGSDDCSVKLWSIAERNSTSTIWNPANVCCVQFSAHSSHLLAFGSADYKIYCYDLRHTRIPWCTLAGHRKAVSYVKFLDSETLVSASTDNTLKLWNLKKTSLEGLSLGACSLTFTGHTNEKNFVGLSVLDGYIACGSETNEVYAYYRSLPMPITSHKFGSVDPISGQEIYDSNGHFVSSVCWRTKSNIVVSANSTGNIKLLRMV